MAGKENSDKKRLTRRRGACIRCKHKKIRCNGGRPRCNQCKTDESCMYVPNPTRRKTKKSYKSNKQLAPLRPSLLPDNFYFDPSLAGLGQPEALSKPLDTAQPGWDPLLGLEVPDVIPDLDCQPLLWSNTGLPIGGDLFSDVLAMPAGGDMPELTHSITPSIEGASRVNSLSGESLYSCGSSASGPFDLTIPSAAVDATLISEVLQAIASQPNTEQIVQDLHIFLQETYDFVDRPMIPDTTLAALSLEAVQDDLRASETDDYLLEYFASQTIQQLSQATILTLKSQIVTGAVPLIDNNIPFIYSAIAIGCRLRKMKSRRHQTCQDPDYYFKRALIWLPQLTAEPPVFAKVQALIPMITYAKSSLCTNFSRYLISEAVRMAFALRMNLLEGSDVSNDDQNHKQRVFMILYSWEKPLSMRFNVQSAIDDDYIAFDLEDVASGQALSSSDQIFHDLCFARICSRVSKELCSPRALKNTPKQQAAIRATLQDSLGDWLSSIPASERQDVQEARASPRHGEGTFVLQKWNATAATVSARRVLLDVADMDVRDVDEECLSALLASFCIILHQVVSCQGQANAADDTSLLVAACGKMATIGRHNPGFDYSGFMKVCADLHEMQEAFED
ncbi:hypothetical protein BDZ85DRAFT_317248 [Elsinoe ampelina]|uniref:Zn(2)-C6 fungal-type domain-containing protein n=1 Tax=Elsinoe ampelina TaxID=302913 RepID=A0A6A6GKW7_9PEZI|nr:hypothetical protein BDZ85DRAFT_317248 [Elsinoe ampelina]